MKIGICTPCYDGTVHHEHMHSSIESDRIARQNNVEIGFYTGPGNANLPKVRNILAATALADKCDWVVMIDADIAWEPNDLFKMLSHGVDVVAAGPAKRHNRWDEQPAAVAKFGATTDEAKTLVGRLWRAEGAATAMMAIRANVFAQTKRVTTGYETEGISVRDWFWFSLVDAMPGKRDEGEDYHFCRKYIETGGTVWIDPDIRLRHYSGTVCHDICFADGEKNAR